MHFESATVIMTTKASHSIYCETFSGLGTWYSPWNARVEVPSRCNLTVHGKAHHCLFYLSKISFNNTFDSFSSCNSSYSYWVCKCFKGRWFPSIYFDKQVCNAFWFVSISRIIWSTDWSDSILVVSIISVTLIYKIASFLSRPVDLWNSLVSTGSMHLVKYSYSGFRARYTTDGFESVCLQYSRWRFPGMHKAMLTVATTESVRFGAARVDLEKYALRGCEH